MRIGINILNFGPSAIPSVLQHWATEAETFGYHSVTISNHVAVTLDISSRFATLSYDRLSRLPRRRVLRRELNSRRGRYAGVRPAVLVVESVRLPALLSGEKRVRNLASAVNQSDLAIRTGIRRADPFPYILGLEITGEVVGSAVSDFRLATASSP